MRFSIFGEIFILVSPLRFVRSLLSTIWYWYSVIRGFVYIIFESIRASCGYKRVVAKTLTDFQKLIVELFEMFGMGLKYEATEEGELVLLLGLTHRIILYFAECVLLRGRDKMMWIVGYMVELIRDARRKLIKVSRLIKYKEKGVIPIFKPLLPRTRKEKRR